MSATRQQLLGQIDGAASAYHADPAVLEQMATLESGMRPGAVNNYDSNAKRGTPSQGLFQFIQPTYAGFSKQARAANPRAWKGVADDWMNPQAQALTAAWAIKNGHGHDWTTYKRALSVAGKGAATSGVAPPLVGTAPTTPTTAPPSASNPALVEHLLGSGFKALAGVLAARPATAPLSTVANTGLPATAGAAPAPSGPGFGHSYKTIESFVNRLTGAHLAPTVEQTTGGHHAAHSLHYAGRAVDYGDATTSPQQLQQIAAYARAHPQGIQELFYNPLGWGIRNGKIIKGLTEPGHDDHIHIGVA